MLIACANVVYVCAHDINTLEHRVPSIIVVGVAILLNTSFLEVLLIAAKSDQASFVQADLALASAQNTSRSHSGLQASSLAQLLEAGNFRVRDTFQALTDRSKGTAAVAHSASGLTVGQSLSALNTHNVKCAEDLDNSLPGSLEDGTTSAYSSGSSSSCSSISSPHASNDCAPNAHVEHTHVVDSRSKVRLMLDHHDCH